jgi:YD repeat-containing protein
MRTRLFLLLLFLPLARCFGDALLYRSNDFGMRLELIEPYRRDESEWILAIERTAAGEMRRLYDHGAEVHSWEFTLTPDGGQRVERELVAGALDARRVYDPGGSLLQEELYEAGSLSQRSTFTYTGRRLSKVRVLGPDGSHLYTEEYLYAVNGALREVRRTGAGGDQQRSTFVTGAVGLSEERSTAGSALFISRYDTRGRIVSRERRVAGETVSREDFTFRPDSNHLLASTERHPGEGKVLDRRYDDEGRLVSETTMVRDVTIEVVRYAMDDQGRVTGKTRRSTIGLETWKYSLGGDGAVTREEYYRLGSLVKVTSYGEKKQRIEELYDKGELILKVFYDGDARVREEVYSEGKLLKERSYL